MSNVIVYLPSHYRRVRDRLWTTEEMATVLDYYEGFRAHSNNRAHCEALCKSGPPQFYMRQARAEEVEALRFGVDIEDVLVQYGFRLRMDPATNRPYIMSEEGAVVCPTPRRADTPGATYPPISGMFLSDYHLY
jgi:hypothetical protein